MKDRKPYIDLIRAFSVCLIVFYHFCGPFRYMGGDPTFCEFKNGDWGNVGVFLFFMISGSCLIYQYEDTFPIKSFYKKRFLRIMIPFWICYCIAFLYNFLQSRVFPPLPLYKLLLTAIGMDGYLSYRTATFYILGEWFLGCIILLYLVFPLVRICVKKNIHITLGTLFLLNLFLYHNNFFGFFRIPTDWNLLVALFYFVYGAWLEKMLGRIKNTKIRYALLPLFLLFACGVIWIKVPINRYIGAFLLTSCFYVLLLHAGKLMDYKIFSAPVMVLSRNSYLIFLIHHFIIFKVAEHFPGSALSVKELLFAFFLCCSLMTVFILCYNSVVMLIRKLIQKFAAGRTENHS